MPSDEHATLIDTATQTRSRTASDHGTSRPGLVVWNHEPRTAVDIAVRFHDDGAVVFHRTLTVPPAEVVPVRPQLERGEYRVEVQTDDLATASSTCHIGEGVLERALVEIGNGTISVVEGF